MWIFGKATPTNAIFPHPLDLFSLSPKLLFSDITEQPGPEQRDCFPCFEGQGGSWSIPEQLW